MRTIELASTLAKVQDTTDQELGQRCVIAITHGDLTDGCEVITFEKCCVFSPLILSLFILLLISTFFRFLGLKLRSFQIGLEPKCF